ncbi:lytic transglycosylase domain-containing protein [Demequina soli]|uniref:lytic transglycosylase domain-containing protein n=1 Tax=Demequina soli TaxID=1638987 RepID=UPI0007820577|nr:lytic transglycosylase domain-containing protein [Demequina soli]
MAATSTPASAARTATTAALVTVLGIATADAAAADEQHRVEPGDTVSALAHRYGTTIPAIVAANDLDARATIYVGTTVTIPDHRGASAPAKVTHLSATYTVKAGDTLSEIAHRHGTTVARIARDNHLANASLIFPGQRLTLGGNGAGAGTGGTSSSASHASGTSTQARASATYTVKAGDTLSEIAQHHGTTVATLARANHLANASLIRVGQRLTIPGAKPAASPAGGASGSTTASSTASRGHYTVKAGDTLSEIAQRHGTTVATIARENRLANASTIYVGQRLLIPATPKALVGDTFAGRTYASSIVDAANRNKATLLARAVPTRAEMRDLISATARRHGVDATLALAVAYQESGFDMRAVSPANAVGVMQVIPTSGQWASDMAGRRLDLLDPSDNVTAGVLILRSLTRTFDKVDDAIAGYYQGAAAVKDHGYHSDTVGYVASVKALMRSFG